MSDRDEVRKEVGTAASSTTNPNAALRQDLEQPPEHAGKIGGAAGAGGGAVAGATGGMMVAGPIGAAVGAVAGALGGWWAGQAADTVEYGEEDDRYYRRHFETLPDRPSDRRYEDVQAAYHIGHAARFNPEYEGRGFDAVERDLRRAWTDDLRSRHGEWDVVRPYIRTAYERRRQEAAARGDDTVTERPADYPTVTEAKTGDRIGPPGLTTDEPPASGSWNDHLGGQRRGFINPDAGADMGGNPSHHRASYNDPASPEAELRQGSEPDWMRQSSDQGGFGAHVAEDASERDATVREPSDAREKHGTS